MAGGFVPPSDSTIQTSIAADWRWVTNHLILLAAAGLLVFGAVRFTDGILEKHAAAEDQKWQGILASQQTATQTLLKQTADHEAEWQKENQQQTSLIAHLSSSIQKRDEQTSQTIKQDATLDTKSAAEKLSSQINFPVSANVDNSVSIGLDGVRVVVQKLDSIPALQADLSDSTKEIDAQKTIITNLTSDVAEQKASVGSVQAQLAAQITADKKELAEAKAVARKSKARWFFAGVVTGVFAKRILIGAF
jgi:hypothetical protein